MWLLAIIALLVGALVFARGKYLNALLDKHNAEAARDSSRVVFRDSLHTVSERLAFEMQLPFGQCRFRCLFSSFSR